MNYSSIAEQIGPRTGATQEWVYRVLRHGIVSGELPGGAQLKQDEISAALNVSHIPVREALRQLEALGLVRIHPNRGASVTQLSRSTLLDMMEVRATLSVMALRNSAPLLTEEDYDALDAVIAAQRQETDLFRTEELNYRFHDLLSYHAENSVSNRSWTSSTPISTGTCAAILRQHRHARALHQRARADPCRLPRGRF